MDGRSFWLGLLNRDGYGIFPNLRDIVGLDAAVYELSEGKERNRA